MMQTQNITADPVLEPEALTLARIRERRDGLDREIKDLADKVADVERRAAARLLEGDDSDGEDLVELRQAQRRVRDELRIANRAITIARERRDLVARQCESTEAVG